MPECIIYPHQPAESGQIEDSILYFAACSLLPDPYKVPPDELSPAERIHIKHILKITQGDIVTVTRNNFARNFSVDGRLHGEFWPPDDPHPYFDGIHPDISVNLLNKIFPTVHLLMTRLLMGYEGNIEQMHVDLTTGNVYPLPASETAFSRALVEALGLIGKQSQEVSWQVLLEAFRLGVPEYIHDVFDTRLGFTRNQTDRVLGLLFTALVKDSLPDPNNKSLKHWYISI